MAKLVIVESPAKAKTIGKYLGDDYEVTASMGHIRDLPASQLGIDVEHGYTPQYISIKGKEKLIKELKSKAKHADGVLLATDPDREGEAISWHLANILGLDPYNTKGSAPDQMIRGRALFVGMNFVTSPFAYSYFFIFTSSLSRNADQGACSTSGR